MSNNKLKIVFWNAGLNSKINEHSAFINSNNIDIVLIGETKIRSSTKIKFRSYHMHHTDDTPQGSPASGGTAILVHRKIVHKQIQYNTSLFSTTIEVSINNVITQISSVYKRPV